MDHNPDNRGANVPVVDTDSLQAEYSKLPARGSKKSAAAAPSVEDVTIRRMPDFFADVARENTVKSANLQSYDPGVTYRESFGERMQDVFGNRESIRAAHEEIIDIASELVDTKRAKTAALQRQLLDDPHRITTLFCDMHAASGYEKRALDELRAKLAGFDASRATLRDLDVQVAKHASVKRWLQEDRTGLTPAVQEIAGLNSRIEAAHELMIKLAAQPPDFAGVLEADPSEPNIVDAPDAPHRRVQSDDSRTSTEAGGAAGQSQRSGPKAGGGPGDRPGGDQRKTDDRKTRSENQSGDAPTMRDAPSKAQAPGNGVGLDGHIDDISAAVNTALGHVPTGKSTLDYLMGASEGGVIPGMLGAYAPGKRQAKIDRGVDDVQTITNLQRVIATDPVLAEADPHSLIAIFNDLRQADPTISASSNRLRMALREAVQYEGMTSQSTKTLADIDKTQAQANAARVKSMQDLYQQ